MKKNWLPALSLCMLFFACSKEKKAQNPVLPMTKVPVTISVSDFIKKAEALPSPLSRSASLSGVFAKDSTLIEISDIYFFVFNNYGEKVRYTHQKSEDDNFGIISDSLPTGEYTIALAASSDSLFIENSNISIGYDQNFTITKPFPDIFYNRLQIKVNADSSASNTFDVLLKRLVGFLEVNIKDAPAISEDSSVQVTLAFEHTDFNPFLNTAHTGAVLYQPMKISRRNQNVFNEFILNTDEELTVTISYPDRTTNAILTKTIQHVRFNKNAKTILTGNIYTTPPAPGQLGNGFNVRIDNAWDSTQVTNF